MRDSGKRFDSFITRLLGLKKKKETVKVNSKENVTPPQSVLHATRLAAYHSENECIHLNSGCVKVIMSQERVK